MGNQLEGDSWLTTLYHMTEERLSPQICLQQIANLFCVEAPAGLGKGTQEKEDDEEAA